jgi:hypothetical protein
MIIVCALLPAREPSPNARKKPTRWTTHVKQLLPFTALFFSLSTLVCCALPALFVALGAGATFVSLLGSFPQLIWISENKGLVFSLAAALLALSTLHRRLIPRECPTDPQLALQCTRARRISGVVSALSWLSLLIGCFFAFIAPFLW